MILQDVLSKYFKLSSFRNNQEAIANAVLVGKDVLVVMPTGGGKSLCYQLPALLLPGVTIVVSPLISLMQDQLESLERLGVPATLINSTLSVAELNERFRNIYAGQYKLIYIAPERFRSSRFVEAIKSLKVSLFAIDEAHCISQWGHDFRPDYLWLGSAIASVGRPPIIALTATATPTVQDDIVNSLKLIDPEKFVSGFARPNLELRVINAEKDVEKYGHLGRLIESQRKGIIYCATRKRVEKVAEILRTWDCSMVAYHAGLSDDERKKAQTKFIQGDIDVAVATNAFGMGIDRADLRFVAHFEMPGSLEAYYQEVGRAGRDGNPSICEFYYSYADKRVQEFFIDGSNPSKQMLQNVYRQLIREANLQNEVLLSIDELAERAGFGKNSMAVGTCLSILSRTRCVERFDIPQQRIKGTRLLNPDLNPNNLPIDYDALLVKENRDREKLETVIRFATSIGCRQQWILSYFGEAKSDPCNCCDHCKRGESSDRREPRPKELMDVKIALSGVARMSTKTSLGTWQPRFGRGKIIQMLVGSKDKGILDIGLDKLSTYGMLQNLGKDYLNNLFKELERGGLLHVVTSNNMPLLTLTAKGAEVMQGNSSFSIVWPEEKSWIISSPKKMTDTKTATSDVISGVDADLYELLRQKRSEIAKQMRNARLFMVLSNKTLEHLASQKPRTVEAARDIPGIGPAKMQTVLPKFLVVINDFLDRR